MLVAIHKAIDKADGEWILSLDADEEVDPSLLKEISWLLQAIPMWLQRGMPVGNDTESKELRDRGLRIGLDEDDLNGFVIPRKNYFLGRWIRHGDWYPDHCLRLVRRASGRWAGTSEHTKIELLGVQKELEGDLLHWSFPTVRRFVEKQLSYADSFAERAVEEGRTWTLWDNITRPIWRLFRGYILRAGFLDGFPGLWVAVGNAYATFVRYSRLFELRVATRSDVHNDETRNENRGGDLR